MSEDKREVEARGQDVEAAVQAGLSQLGVDRNEVIVEIIDEGSRGLLGIGSRDAVVRLTSLASTRPEEPSTQPVTSKPSTVPPRTREETGPDMGGDDEDTGEVAVTVMQALMERMRISAEVSAHLSEPDDLTGRQIYIITIEGNDLGLLIGPRGETLNAIQQISRLMVGHKLRRRVDFVVDIQGYRERREQALARLAERMAKKVHGRRRPISLEPMPPHERRVIHMTLRDDDSVYTQSTGEGKRRRVRILPKDREQSSPA
jgi:spoIIIJ-associated protein